MTHRRKQCVAAQCACKMAAKLNRGRSELTTSDLRPATFRTSAVTVLLCHFTYLLESDLKLTFLHLLFTNIAVNITKAFRGSAVTQTA